MANIAGYRCVGGGMLCVGARVVLCVCGVWGRVQSVRMDTSPTAEPWRRDGPGIARLRPLRVISMRPRPPWLHAAPWWRPPSTLAASSRARSRRLGACPPPRCWSSAAAWRGWPPSAPPGTWAPSCACLTRGPRWRSRCVALPARVQARQRAPVPAPGMPAVGHIAPAARGGGGGRRAGAAPPPPPPREPPGQVPGRRVPDSGGGGERGGSGRVRQGDEQGVHRGGGGRRGTRALRLSPAPLPAGRHTRLPVLCAERPACTRPALFSASLCPGDVAAAAPLACRRRWLCSASRLPTWTSSSPPP
jgi:hypothetical protein